MKYIKIHILLLLLVILTVSLGAQQQIRFGMNYSLGFENQFDSETWENNGAWLQSKGLMRFQAEAWNVLHVTTEVSMNERWINIYSKDSSSWSDGLQHFAVDFPSNPVSYLLGPLSLDYMKLVFQNPYVVTEMGFKYAKLPHHQNALWTTVDGEWEAGYDSTGGYLHLSTGSRLNHIGPVRFRAALMPNKSADRAGNQYGMLGWAAFQFMGHTLDFQYNGAYGRDKNINGNDDGWLTIFDEIYETDLILGYNSTVAGLNIQANFLYNLWGAEKVIEAGGIEKRRLYTPPSSDVSNVLPEAYKENFAGAIRLFYDLNKVRAGRLAVGYRLRGSQANMMYVEQGSDSHDHITDQLGGRNTQHAYVDYTLPGFLRGFNSGVYAGSEFILFGDGRYQPYNPNNMKIEVNPWLDYNLREIRLNARVWVYANMDIHTDHKVKRGDAESPFLLEKLGVRVETGSLSREVRSVEVFAGFDNQEENYWYNSYLATVRLINNLNIQGGFMLRIPHSGVEENKNPVGAFAGVNYRLPILTRPMLYAQFLWNMNPYKSMTDGVHIYDMDGYLTAGYVRNNYNGLAAIRLGLRWEM